jgi:hypothetical protein
MEVGAAEELEAEGAPAVVGPLAGVPGWEAVEEVLPMVAMRVVVPQRQIRCRCVMHYARGDSSDRWDVRRERKKGNW